jgi:hypothetical protein
MKTVYIIEVTNWDAKKHIVEFAYEEKKVAQEYVDAYIAACKNSDIEEFHNVSCEIKPLRII